MEEAARAWTLELDRVSTDLSYATQRIQSSFADLSGISLSNCGESIPDPVKILRRLASLESNIEILRSECEELASRRPALAVEVTEILSKNNAAINELAFLVEGHNSPTESSEELNLRISQQNQCWGLLHNKIPDKK